MGIETPFEVTKTVYTVLDFVEWQRGETLNLRPYFQRGSVWTPKAKSYFIDTLLRGYPVPVIYLQNRTSAKTLRNVRQVVDGQQRLRTVLAYIDSSMLSDRDSSDEFSIMRSHNLELAEVPFGKLPEYLKERLTNTELSVHVLPSKIEDSELLQLFARLNSTGEKLNDQELRNAAYHGVFKAFAYDLAYSQIDRWRDWGLYTPRALAQMKEVEFTSELAIMLMRGIAAKSKTSIDAFYNEFDDEFPYAGAVEERFLAVFSVLDSIFKNERRQSEQKILQTQSWVYALFAAIAGTAYGTIEGDLGAPVNEAVEPDPAIWTVVARRVRNSLVHDRVPDELAKALRGASSDRSSRVARRDFILKHM